MASVGRRASAATSVWDDARSWLSRASPDRLSGGVELGFSDAAADVPGCLTPDGDRPSLSLPPS